MKKIIAAITALFVCTAMLTACNTGTADTSEEILNSITSGETMNPGEDSKEGEADKTEKADEATTTASEETTTAETDPGNQDVPDDDAPAASFASVDELSKTDFVALATEQVAAEDSYAYEFMKTLENADGFYLDVKSTDGNMAMKMAFDANKNIAISVFSAKDDTTMDIIITDMTLYMLDPTTKTGLYYAVDESIFDQYNPEEALGQIAVDEGSLANAEALNCCTVKINGKDYVLEAANNAGLLFETNGTLYAIVTNDPSSELTALIVNEFSGNVPANAFDIPSDYELADLMSAFSGLGE